MTRSLAVMLVAGLLGGCGNPPGIVNGMVVGTWGGDDGGLLADDTSAHAHIGCTYGNTKGPIVVESGRFDAAGSYNITAFPVDIGIFHPARFYGAIFGDRMTLVVTLTDTAVTLGPIDLVYGREPRMQVCPICRTLRGSRRKAITAAPALPPRDRADPRRTPALETRRHRETPGSAWSGRPRG